MTGEEKTFNLIVRGTNKIELPNFVFNKACSVGLVYLHVEFEKPTSNEYIKLVSNSAANGNNLEGIIYAFFQPARMKNIVGKPVKVTYTDFRQKYEQQTVKLITEKENKVKRMMIRVTIVAFD